jgi:uncharacterized protein YbjT (DUF2867 family)
MILVTGGTGRLGGNIVRMLRQARADVRCLVRPGSEYFWLNDTGAAYFFGDLRNPTSLRRALNGCDLVIHAAGVAMESTENHHGVTTLQGSKDLIDAAVEKGVRHFVLTSCAAVDHAGEIPGLAFRAEVEEHLRSSGLSFTILRFAPFVDEVADIARRARARDAGFAVVWADGDATFTPIWRRDAAIYTIASLDHPLARNQTLTIGGPEQLTVREAVDQAFKAAGYETTVHYLGDRQANLAGTFIAKILGRRWENYVHYQNALYGADTVVDMSELQAAIGLPLTPYADALAASLDEEHPSEDPTARDTRVTHRQFQATVYEPGEIGFEELPEGPLKFTTD